ncbi:MAG: PLP-dependent aminotransferase family protein [Clostridia bacterium]|nr:PLP-dependent aminotransferase family protein [Clostridia bacterium]
MKYHIDNESSSPAYLQLYEQMKNDIVSQMFPFGSKLPSKRTIATETGLSVITVQHAVMLLCDEGYIEARERSGYFVIYRLKDFSARAEMPINYEMPEIHTHSSSGEFPFSVFAKTARRVLLDYGDKIFVKSPNHGTAELRGAISSYLARNNGIVVSPEQVIIGAGAEYLYSLIVQLFGKNKIYAYESPCYEKIRRVYEANGVMCEALKMGNGGIKTSELERTQANILHITPFNSFPSGITANATKRYEYIKWARERDAYIIEDNYDSELTVSKKNEDTVFSLDNEGRVLYLNTFSKTVAPAMRVGYLILPKNLLREFEEKLGFYSCTVPVFEQYVLSQLILSGDFERHINRIRRKRRKELK